LNRAGILAGASTLNGSPNYDHFVAGIFYFLPELYTRKGTKKKLVPINKICEKGIDDSPYCKNLPIM